MYVCMYVCMYIYTYIRMYVYIYISVCMCIYIYITGWWLSHPLKKYESQLGWWNSKWKTTKCSKPPSKWYISQDMVNLKRTSQFTKLKCSGSSTTQTAIQHRTTSHSVTSSEVGIWLKIQSSWTSRICVPMNSFDWHQRTKEVVGVLSSLQQFWTVLNATHIYDQIQVQKDILRTQLNSGSMLNLGLQLSFTNINDIPSLLFVVKNPHWVLESPLFRAKFDFLFRCQSSGQITCVKSAKSPCFTLKT